MRHKLEPSTCWLDRDEDTEHVLLFITNDDLHIRSFHRAAPVTCTPLLHARGLELEGMAFKTNKRLATKF